jgi:hypothetical protein
VAVNSASTEKGSVNTGEALLQVGKEVLHTVTNDAYSLLSNDSAQEEFGVDQCKCCSVKHAMKTKYCIVLSCCSACADLQEGQHYMTYL